ncbi:ferrochelatase [Azonexus sp.]|uniref:ferrochelatase n=1 Tax=Azonexus sp. TaxID=1872668 RepID=UPI0039E4B534
MPRFFPEPPPPSAAPASPAVVLINLGTPEAPTAPALRRYLAEFLGDPRVVEIPRLIWWPILHGIILTTRPKKSAAKYAAIWTQEGSPLRVHTEKQAKLLQGYLGARGHRLTVCYAMRYGKPALTEVLEQLKAAGHSRILLLPLYPQYAASTTATAIDVAAQWLTRTRNQPQIRFVRDYHADPAYIAALAQSVRRHWQINGHLGERDRLLMSFHGLPERSRRLGDPYYDECLVSGKALADALGLNATQYRISFQSRFGKATWLQPYTTATLENWAREGIERVDVICPGFAADCLETLEEIALEGRADFLAAGGKSYHYIPALNDDPAWIEALADLTERQLAGWL